MKNVICFNKGFISLKNSIVDNRALAMTVQAELMKFGFMLDDDAMNMLGTADKADIVDFNDEIMNYLLDITGGRHNYTPLYKGFPVEVMQLSEYQMWWDQIHHYMSNGTWEPQSWMKPFAKAFESVKYKMIGVGDESKFLSIFTDLCSVNSSLIPTDLEVIKWFVSNKQTLIFPVVIPFKENLCTLAAMGIAVPVKTPTDVLRIAVHMSGGDISLPAVPKKTIKSFIKSGYRGSLQTIVNPERIKFKFKKFSRADRRLILGLLEQTHCDPREMVLKDQRWIRLGEILHPGEYSTQYPKAYEAFRTIREDRVISWYGEVDKAFNTSLSQGLEKLSQRPGEFLRRLDFLIRKTENNSSNLQLIFDVFSKVAILSSNKVLFEVFTHFESRDKPVTNRSIFIKGARNKTALPNLPALQPYTIEAVKSVIFSALREKFGLLPEMGDCWIDPELKKIPLPTNMRSMSESLVPIIRGQRVPFQADKKYLRAFIHWYDQKGNEDLDLHGYLVDKHGNSAQFGFNGIHSASFGCYSGDVRNRQGACSEYVDINLNVAINAGYKYFVMVIHNFTGRSFKSLKDCVVGTMERENSDKNMNWLPDTIVNCYKPTSDAQYGLVGAFDLETHEYIHLDLDLNTAIVYAPGVNDTTRLLGVINNYLELPQYSVYDLLQWHIEARGRAVTKETAITQFLYDDFSGSYVETLKFMGI